MTTESLDAPVRNSLIAGISTAAVLSVPTAAAADAAATSDPVRDAWVVIAGDEEIHVWKEGWEAPVPLTDDRPGGLFNGEPAWSPDGSRIGLATRYLIGYAEGEIHAARIEVMDADGRNRRTLVDPTDGAPAWSPDGTEIAFVADDEIQVMSADGSDRRSLGPGWGDPEWSPDGTRIAYMWSFDVWVMDADGANARNLTDSAGIETDPSWSPDGRHIAYSHRDAGDTIRVLDLGTNGSAAGVTDELVEGRHPVWSPDGDRLAFWRSVEEDEDGPGIYVVDVDGSDPEPRILVPFDVYFDGFDWVRPSARFIDVGPDHLFAADISWLATEDITRGCNPPFNTRFCADGPATRGEVAAFLVRALDLSDRGDGDWFSDDDQSIFEADIDKLRTAGITTGCNPPANTEFCPDDLATRGQVAAFLVHALGFDDDPDRDLFVDDDGSVFESVINRLGAAGVTRGCNPPDNTEFCPTAHVTRGQMAAFLHRALGTG